MNKKGLSIAEMMAFFIVASLTVILVGNIVMFMSNSLKVSYEEGQLSMTGAIVERQLHNRIDSFKPNYAEFCDGTGLSTSCSILLKDYNFEWNESSNLVDLVDETPDLTMTIEFINGELLVDGEVFDTGNFIVSSNSEFAVYKNGTTDSITLVLNLVLDGRYGVTETFYITYIIEQI